MGVVRALEIERLKTVVDGVYEIWQEKFWH